MAKPLNIKPVQIYPSPELYDSIKETVDAGKYRSMNAAVIALVEIALQSGKDTNNQGNTHNTIDIDVIQRLESQISELISTMSNTVKREELDVFKTEILEIIASNDQQGNSSDTKDDDELWELEQAAGGAFSIPVSKIDNWNDRKKEPISKVPTDDKPWSAFTRDELGKMEEDEVKKVYRKAVPSIERQKGSPLHADKVPKAKMIEMILERSQ